MERLDTAQIQAIKKLSTSRLVSKLSRVGYTEEEIDVMDRDAMLATWAECVANGKDKPETVTLPTVGYDVQLEREKLEFEKQKLEVQRQLKMREIEAQEKLKQAEIESQEKLKHAELKQREEKLAAARAEKESVVNLAKRYGDAMKASVKPMGPEMLDVVLFFRHIEAIFQRFDVPVNLQAALVQPYLNDKARSVVSRMDPDLCNDYKAVREVILKEHKLTPCAYLELFNKLTRAPGETTVMFCARLKSLLSMYVESRKVVSFDGLMSLVICDRIKSTLSENCLRHVLSVEAGTTTGWLEAQPLAECIDLYRANHFDNDKPRASAIGSTTGVPRVGNGSVSGGGGHVVRHVQSVQSRQTTGQPVASGAANSKLTCYKCKQVGHTRRFCPQNSQPADRRVNTCCRPTTLTQELAPQPVISCMDAEQFDNMKASSEDCLSVFDESNTCLLNDKVEPVMNDDKSYISDYESYRDCVSLQYVDVSKAELDEAKKSNDDRPVACVRALEDSGSELCVVKSSLVESVVLPKAGTGCLRGIVGAPVMADLVNLHISLVNDSTGCTTSLPVTCAICPNMNEDMILTTAFVKQLRCVTGTNSVCFIQCDNICDNVDCLDRIDSVDDTEINVNNTCLGHLKVVETVQTDKDDDNVVADKSSVTIQTFLKEQQSDETLKTCWDKAKPGRDGLEIRNELLYHIEHVDCVGEKCSQLCLPASRRKTVLELAHSTLGCHQASRRTRDRIRLSFFWPTMTKDVRDLCDACEACQKPARLAVWDHTPITAVPRAQYAFRNSTLIAQGRCFQIRKRTRIITSLFCAIRLRRFLLYIR